MCGEMEIPVLFQGSGMGAGNNLFRPPAVFNNEIYVADLISPWCVSYSIIYNITHMSCF